MFAHRYKLSKCEIYLIEICANGLQIQLYFWISGYLLSILICLFVHLCYSECIIYLLVSLLCVCVCNKIPAVPREYRIKCVIINNNLFASVVWVPWKSTKSARKRKPKKVSGDNEAILEQISQASYRWVIIIFYFL